VIAPVLRLRSITNLRFDPKQLCPVAFPVVKLTHYPAVTLAAGDVPHYDREISGGDGANRVTDSHYARYRLVADRERRR